MNTCPQCNGIRVFVTTTALPDGTFIDHYRCLRCWLVSAEPAQTLDDTYVVSDEDTEVFETPPVVTVDKAS